MSRQARVGALVLGIFALLLYLSPGRSQREQLLGNEYGLVFEHVNGLREGDGVKFAGVSAGRVTSIDFTTRTQKDRFGPRARVVVKIITDYGLSIPENSLVSVESNLSGSRWVEIAQGTSETPLEPGSVTALERRTARQNEVEGTLGALKDLKASTEVVRDAMEDPDFRRSMKDVASNARFYSNEFRTMSTTFDDHLDAFDKDLTRRERAVLRQLARIEVQIDDARRRTEEMVPRVNEEIHAWERRIQGSDHDIRAMVDTATRETERFRKLAEQAEDRVIGGKVDEKVRQEVERLATRVEEIAALAEDLHGITSSPEVQAELRGMIEKYRRQAEELRRNLERWEKAIP